MAVQDDGTPRAAALHRCVTRRGELPLLALVLEIEFTRTSSLQSWMTYPLTRRSKRCGGVQRL